MLTFPWVWWPGRTDSFKIENARSSCPFDQTSGGIRFLPSIELARLHNPMALPTSDVGNTIPLFWTVSMYSELNNINKLFNATIRVVWPFHPSVLWLQPHNVNNHRARKCYIASAAGMQVQVLVASSYSFVGISTMCYPSGPLHLPLDSHSRDYYCAQWSWFSLVKVNILCLIYTTKYHATAVVEKWTVKHHTAHGQNH